MSSDQRIVLRLEVDREADPITGTLTQCGHAQRGFTGWLALSNAIESIRTGEGEAAAPDVRPRENGALRNRWT